MTGSHSDGGRAPRHSQSGTRVQEHLSVDTRLAARAILDDQELGTVSVSETNDSPPAFVEWLDRVRIKLTLGVILAMSCLMVLPIWFEASHRHHEHNLQSSLSTQAKVLVDAVGKETMDAWFRTKDVESFRKHFVEVRPKLLDSLKQNGFLIDSRNLSVRLDYENQTMILGAKSNKADGNSMTWASPSDQVVLRPLPDPSLGAVFREHRDMLTLIGSIITLCLAFIWVAPAIYRKRARS